MKVFRQMWREHYTQTEINSLDHNFFSLLLTTGFRSCFTSRLRWFSITTWCVPAFWCKTSYVVGTWRPVCSLKFVTYQGASTIWWRILDWHLWTIPTFDSETHPFDSNPNPQMCLTTCSLYSLLVPILPIDHCNSLVSVSTRFLFLATRSLLSKCNDYILCWYLVFQLTTVILLFLFLLASYFLQWEGFYLTVVLCILQFMPCLHIVYWGFMASSFTDTYFYFQLFQPLSEIVSIISCVKLQVMWRPLSLERIVAPSPIALIPSTDLGCTTHTRVVMVQKRCHVVHSQINRKVIRFLLS